MADDQAQIISALEGMTGPRTAETVGRAVASLIHDGTLRPGSRLPTVRQVAHVCGVSTGTIVAAWSTLRRDGFVETRRRGGTMVLGAGPSIRNESGAHGSVDWSARDLLSGSPDYAMQPDLSAALLAGLSSSHELNRPGREYITEPLLSAVQAHWPFQAQAWTAAGGGSEGLILATEAAASAGGVVAIEEPAMPGFLDTLSELNIQPVGLCRDSEGPLIRSLQEALELEPVALVLQPEGSYAMEGSLSTARAADLARVLMNSPTRPWIIEDDGVGPLAVRQAASLGPFLPDHTVRVRSYCKAYGIDIRTCVIGGSEQLVAAIIDKRTHGVAMNSRILQNTLAHLINSDEAKFAVAAARDKYRTRRERLINALARQGLRAQAGDNSLVLWVEVSDENSALISLARKGIVVGSGSKSFIGKHSRALLRVAIPQLPDEDELAEELATRIAEASCSRNREYLA